MTISEDPPPVPETPPVSEVPPLPDLPPTAPPTVPPTELPVAEAPALEAPVADPGRRRRVVLTAVGLLAVTATSAALTVAVGKPADRSRPTAAAAAGASPSPTAAAPTLTATPTPTPSVTTPAPKPSSTLHGTVDGAKHGGDIRFFLLPMPDGAESYGSEDGTTLSTDDVVQSFGNSSDMKSILDSYNFQGDAAERRYRTANGQEEVLSRLMRFGSHSMAADFAKGISFKVGTPISIDGDDSAQGVSVKPEQEAWTGEMIGVSSVGDVEYEIKVYVKGTPDKALLIDAMKRQRERLASGG